MPAVVHRDQPELVGEVRVHLVVPREPGLRVAVDEQDRSTVRLPGLVDVEVDTAAARDRV
jgi:hypothetical protein